jgi:hypothetical protein
MLSMPGLTANLPRGVQILGLACLPPIANAATLWLAPLALPHQRMLGNQLRLNPVHIVYSRKLQDLDMFYGHQVLRVGDLDGDALEDLCITAPAVGVHGGGFVELRNLADGSLLDTWISDEPGRAFARAIDTLGDVDGDFCCDLVVGTPALTDFDLPEVTLISGRTGESIWTIEGDSLSFGVTIAALGDLDGDGVRDFVVGEPPMTLEPEDRGRAHVYSGRDGRRIAELIAERGGVWFGAAVASAGDVTGDGFDDIAVGGNFGRAPGLVSLFDGKTRELLTSFTEQSVGSDFGARVLGLGDVDGDGRCDLAIAAPAISHGGLPGRVHVIGSKSWKTVYELQGDRAGDQFGATLCHLPWWRKRDDAAIAVTARRGGPIGNGYVRVFGTSSGVPVQTFAANPDTATFGYSLVDLGDTNGDGYRDLGVSRISRDLVASLWSLSLADLPLEDRSK